MITSTISIRERIMSNQIALLQIVAESPKMKELVVNLKKFAALDAPLLIQGETGTGKDLMAKIAHQLSPRKDHKFIAVNCAGLPDENAESEMFGQVSENKTTQGFFEYANGGTVLLDNISDLSLSLQAKLLRFLNDGTFRRVGEEAEQYADVRVIATSQIPLEHYVKEDKLRADLFHRLNVLTLNIPPLRERLEDIPTLVSLFVTEISEKLGILTPHIEPDAIQYLQQASWSGNVRELYNSLYRACSLMEQGGEVLTRGLLNLPISQSLQFDVNQFGEASLQEIMDQFEALVLKKFYEQYPSTRKLATRLGVSHTAIANKLKQYGIGK